METPTMATTTPTTPLLLTSRDAAAALRVSGRTLYALTQPRGPLACVRVGPAGGRVMYRPADLVRYVDDLAAREQRGGAL
jgi:hypothetical protein